MGACAGDGVLASDDIESQVLYHRLIAATLLEGELGCALSILRGLVVRGVPGGLLWRLARVFEFGAGGEG